MHSYVPMPVITKKNYICIDLNVSVTIEVLSFFKTTKSFYPT